MKTFEIWSEGYRATGDSSDATKWGEVEAETFPEACRIFFRGNKYFDAERLTIWACELFAKETDARKSFG